MFLQCKKVVLRTLSFAEQDEWAEEPDQGWQQVNDGDLIRHETIRILVLAASLLTLLLSFLGFLFAHTIVPLFVSIVVIFIAYRCLDAHFSASERHPPS